MAITAKMVSDLRAKTGCGMMECKKALTEANGDFDEAVKVLRERGLAVAAKKASRIASEGVVDIMVCDKCGKAAMVEVNAETDFVAKNESFKEFVRGILQTILEKNPANIDELNGMQYLDTDLTVEGKVKDMIHTIGENMNIRRFARYEGGVIGYVHAAGRIGVMVSIEGDVSNADVAEAAKEAGMTDVTHFADCKSLAAAIRGLVKQGDYVLVKASHGLHLEAVVDALTK